MSIYEPCPCTMDNRARGTGLETRVYGIELNAGFATSMPLPVVTVRSESCRFRHTPVQDRLNDTKGKPQNSSRMAPEVQ